MTRPIIALTTDFGESSPYVAAMKGAVLTLAPDVNLVDVTHGIPAQDVRHAALVLADVAERFPPGTIHIVVVDPGVGTARAIVWAEIVGRQYIAPDNGLLCLLARRNQPTRIRTLTERAWWHETVSDTFHGRDVMAPVAARLAMGLDPERLGPPRESLVELDWPEVRIVPGKIQGRVTRADSFGNLVTDITGDMLADAPRGEETRIACGDHETCGIFRTYADQPEMTLIALVGSAGHLELAIVGDSAALMLGIPVGTEVTVAW